MISNRKSSNERGQRSVWYWAHVCSSLQSNTEGLDQRVLVNRHVKVNQRELLAVRTLSAASPHFSMAARPWLWMWVSRSFFSSPRPSVIRDTRLYIRPRSTKRRSDDSVQKQAKTAGCCRFQQGKVKDIFTRRSQILLNTNKRNVVCTSTSRNGFSSFVKTHNDVCNVDSRCYGHSESPISYD